MGGRNAEMTFGIGEIDYSEVYGATRTIDDGLPNAGQLMNLTSMPSDAVVGPILPNTTTTLTAGKIYEITTLPTDAADLAAYKAVLLASGNTTLQLDSEIIVGSTFEVTSDEDLEILAVGFGLSPDITQETTLTAGKQYVLQTVDTTPVDGTEDVAFDGGNAAQTVAEGLFKIDGVSAVDADLAAGTVYTVRGSDLTVSTLAHTFREVNSGDSAFTAGTEYAIVSVAADVVTSVAGSDAAYIAAASADVTTVSYTHLTLPTKA